jgi:hypothetical protein
MVSGDDLLDVLMLIDDGDVGHERVPSGRCNSQSRHVTEGIFAAAARSLVLHATVCERT